MSTFQSRIEDYIGSYADTNALSEWLTAGAKLISDILPSDELEKFATKSIDSGSGVNVKNARVVSVTKDGYRARNIPLGNSAQVLDTNSIFYATSKSPFYYIKAGLGYCVPLGGDFYLYTYPTVAYTDTSIAEFPESQQHAVVLYASIQGATSNLNTVINSLGAETLKSLTPPSVPPVPVFTYTDATGATISSTTITVSSSLPTYTKPVSTANFNNLETYISTEEDFEKASTEAVQQKNKLEQFQMDLYNELNKFNGEAKNYDSELQEAIAQAQLTQQRLLADAQRNDNIELANKAKELEKQVAEYTNSLQRFQVEVASYQAQVSENVQEYATSIQKHSGQVSSYAGLIATLKAEFNDLIKVLMRK